LGLGKRALLILPCEGLILRKHILRIRRSLGLRVRSFARSMSTNGRRRDTAGCCRRAQPQS
jgi:hypothetical protein